MNPAVQSVSPLRRTLIHVFFALSVVGVGCLFAFKLYSFLATVRRDELAGFAFDPILTYAFVAVGFLMLLTWAFLAGQFKDLEGTKHEMMRRVQEQERAEGYEPWEYEP